MISQEPRFYLESDSQKLLSYLLAFKRSSDDKFFNFPLSSSVYLSMGNLIFHFQKRNLVAITLGHHLLCSKTKYLQVCFRWLYLQEQIFPEIL